MLTIKQELDREHGTLYKIIKEQTVLYITSDEFDSLVSQVKSLINTQYVIDYEAVVSDYENMVNTKDIEIDELELLLASANDENNLLRDEIIELRQEIDKLGEN